MSTLSMLPTSVVLLRYVGPTMQLNTFNDSTELVLHFVLQEAPEGQWGDPVHVATLKRIRNRIDQTLRELDPPRVVDLVGTPEPQTPISPR